MHAVPIAELTAERSVSNTKDAVADFGFRGVFTRRA
jgi:hypothetical protein